MSVDTDLSAVLETVSALAGQIARASPECADKAMKIVDLLQDVALQPDRELIQDAIETNMVDSELSEPQLKTMTSAVVGAIRSEPIR